MVFFDLRAHPCHRAQHFRAHVLGRVQRRDREIALLESDMMSEVAAFVLRVRVRRKLYRVELEAGVVGLSRIFHIVEDEELRLRPEEDRVAHAHGPHQPLRLLCY